MHFSCKLSKFVNILKIEASGGLNVLLEKSLQYAKWKGKRSFAVGIIPEIDGTKG